jgi:hypothetical protein
MHVLPSFTQLWPAYPHGEAAAVKALIGGNVDAGWVTNTCVVRVSRALNYGGDPVSSGYSDVHTIRGGDGKRYAFRVSEFKSYMRHRYGPPSTQVAGGKSSAVAGQQGIICFDVGIWSDASGHFDLWDGSQCAHQAYFDVASEVSLWIC